MLQHTYSLCHYCMVDSVKKYLLSYSQIFGTEN